MEMLLAKWRDGKDKYRHRIILDDEDTLQVQFFANLEGRNDWVPIDPGDQCAARRIVVLDGQVRSLKKQLAKTRAILADLR